MDINDPVILDKMKSVKTKIEKLIEQGRLRDAKDALDTYEKNIPRDTDIYSMRAIIFIMEGKLDDAESVLNDGLKNDSYIFDLLFNLAYIYEQKGKYQEAADMYSKAVTVAETDENKLNVQNALDNVKSSDNNIVFKEKKRLVFFVKRGMDSFIGDIINGLSEDYWTRKIIVENYKQIDMGMEWADICWFEWCDELVAYGSKSSLAIEKKVICRLHSYEAFNDYPKNVNWGNVDKLICVAEHIKDNVLSKIGISKDKVSVIYNGIDLDKYMFKKREKGFNIAYVGYINYKKGPMLLLHAFKAIHDIDDRYVLHIAGEFQDERDILYFNQMTGEFKLRDSIKFDGWQTDINRWLEDKNYIICSSLLESQNMSVMQAMTKGIKPLIHNFVGARNIYPGKYIWSTIEDAVQKVRDDNYDSMEYRSLIVNNFCLSDRIEEIRNMIGDVLISIPSKSEFDYSAYWNNRLNQKFDIEGVGYIGLGNIYNSYLYKIRFDILEYIIKNIFSNFSDQDILELGPGIGMFTEYFCNEKVRSYKGIDISFKSVCELSKKYTGFEFIEGDISESQYYSGKKYDLIFAADVLLHLTDEEKYYSTMGHISDALRDNGFCILFDPVSLVNTKSSSSHVRIRDINYIKNVLDDHGMEVVALLPTAFFMNYPFDKALLGDGSNYVEVLFNTISSFFGDNQVADDTKNCVAEWLCALEKKCLVDNEVGLSQKVLLIKKKRNVCNMPNISIKEVWDKDFINEEITYTYGSLINNTELQESGVISKLYDNIKCFTNLNILSNYSEHVISTEKPLVTVGIINYNCIKYLSNCVHSYLNQTYPNIEIILIDDYSTDGSKEMIQDFEKMYSNIRAIYHETNSGGASKGIQEVFSEAKGKYIQWIASDDFVKSDEIENFVKHLEENSQIDYVYSNYNIVDENNRVTNKWCYSLYNTNQVVQTVFNKSTGVLPMNGLYKKSFLDKNNITWTVYRGNDFSCDTLNSLLFIKHGLRYDFINKEFMFYRIHSENTSHNLAKRIDSLISIFDYIIKNFDEKIYINEVEWTKVDNKEQYKFYFLAKFFLKKVLDNLTSNNSPSYVRGSISRKELYQHLEAYLCEGRNYIKIASLLGNTYQEQIADLEKDYNQLMNEFRQICEV